MSLQVFTSEKLLTDLPQLHWEDDVKRWQHVTVDNIKRFLLTTIAADGDTEAANKNMSAHNYLSSGWVDTILMANDDGKSHLKGNVCPYQSLNNTWHRAIVCFDATTDSIIQGTCSCMAGQYGKCSHVAAILYKMEAPTQSGYCENACTDLPCTWNAETKRNIVPVPLQNLKFQKPKMRITENSALQSDSPLALNKVKSFTTNEDDLAAVRNSGLLTLFEATGTLLNDSRLDECAIQLEAVACYSSNSHHSFFRKANTNQRHYGPNCFSYLEGVLKVYRNQCHKNGYSP